MRAFLEASYPRFIGLTGSHDKIDEAKRTFLVFARRAEDPDDLDGYAVPHTAITYVLDPSGQYTTDFADSVNELEMTERLRAVLE